MAMGWVQAVVLVMKRKGWWWAWLCGRGRGRGRGSCSQRVGGWLARLLVLVGLRAVRCGAVPSGSASASGSAYRRAADASGSDGDATCSGGGDGEVKGRRPMVLAGAARPPPWSWCASTARHGFSDHGGQPSFRSERVYGGSGRRGREE